MNIGNDNLDMSVEDQKVTFNLFEAIKHPSDSKACFKVEAIEQEADLVGQHLTSHSPLEKALTNVVDYLTNEKKKDLRAYLEDLDRLKKIPLKEFTFEDRQHSREAQSGIESIACSPKVCVSRRK